MASDSQLQEFQKEWRDGVMNKLDYLTKKLDDMPVLFANQAEFNKLKDQVEILKTFKNKALGVLIAIQTILTVIGYIIGHH